MGVASSPPSYITTLEGPALPGFCFSGVISSTSWLSIGPRIGRITKQRDSKRDSCHAGIGLTPTKSPNGRLTDAKIPRDAALRFAGGEPVERLALLLKESFGLRPGLLVCRA